ncbi:MAG: hypothetical protein EP338_12120 [Bacteroidetes bacterium]|nr:MAG: hypothetical protein EP338_12120 [Bacteroidota bacterium]
MSRPSTYTNWNWSRLLMALSLLLILSFKLTYQSVSFFQETIEWQLEAQDDINDGEESEESDWEAIAPSISFKEKQLIEKIRCSNTKDQFTSIHFHSSIPTPPPEQI